MRAGAQACSGLASISKSLSTASSRRQTLIPNHVWTSDPKRVLAAVKRRKQITPLASRCAALSGLASRDYQMLRTPVTGPGKTFGSQQTGPSAPKISCRPTTTAELNPTARHALEPFSGQRWRPRRLRPAEWQSVFVNLRWRVRLFLPLAAYRPMPAPCSRPQAEAIPAHP
jgi:hypothetical protein